MNRGSLVKILPRRFVPDSEWVSIGGNQYTTEFVPREPEAVYRDDTLLVSTWAKSSCLTPLSVLVCVIVDLLSVMRLGIPTRATFPFQQRM